MLKLLSQRLALALATLLAVSVLIFLLTERLPADLATAILGQRATPETVAAIRAELELDRPAAQRYVDRLRDALHWDFGRSLTNKRPVTTLVGPRLANTILLVLYAAVIAVPVSIFLGILAAIRGNGLLARLVGTGSLAAASLPEFLIGLVLMLCLSVQLRWFPAITTLRPELGFFQHLHVIVLPMSTLVLIVMAHLVRTIRASVLEVMSSRYIETALLKGVPNSRIVLHHVLPNALPAIIGNVTASLVILVAGVVVVESIFTFNGIGRLMVEAVAKRDVPVVQACGLVFAAMFIGINLMGTLLSSLCDPRLRRAR